MLKIKAKTIDEFISHYPTDIQTLLEQIRTTIRKSAPSAIEKICYGIPTFALNGNLVHFAAYNKHIGFYPASSGIEAFQNELTGYSCSKGTIQFPLDKPLPLDLIDKIVRFRVQENLSKKRKSKN
jgi:uncharacterized protein YdhG (YjbR/CyaY superfamily)